MDLNYTRLIGLSLYNNTPLTKTWRYKQRQNVRNLYTLKEVYQKTLYYDIQAIRKAICLEELDTFFITKRKFIIELFYTYCILTYNILPIEIVKKIFTYIIY